jgi:hypothetical protein
VEVATAAIAGDGIVASCWCSALVVAVARGGTAMHHTLTM